jgi:hypothetical protein
MAGMPSVRRFEVTASQALLPRTGRAMGPVRTKIEQIQHDLVEELKTLDQDVRALVRRRREIVTELCVCRDAFGGIGQHDVRRVPLPGEIFATVAETREIGGSALRDAAARMVRLAAWPVSVSDIHRLLLAHGLRPSTPPSMRIANALRPEVAAGRIVRVSRGIYALGDDWGRGA